MNSEWQNLQPQTQQELKNTMNAMQPPQSVEEVKATLETTEKGGVRQSIRNCLTVFQRDPLLSGAIAYNILTDRKDIIKPIGFHRGVRGVVCSPCHQQVKIIGKGTEAAAL